MNEPKQKAPAEACTEIGADCAPTRIERLRAALFPLSRGPIVIRPGRIGRRPDVGLYCLIALWVVLGAMAAAALLLPVRN